MPKHQFHCDAEPEYLAEQSAPEQGHYLFAYTITITNTGEVAAQLISRHWEIEDSHGRTQVVDGLGVVGQQPLLQPGQSFRYTSSAPLATPMGLMSGHFFCVAVDGGRFEAPVGPFVLRAADAGTHPGAGPGSGPILH